LGKKRWKPKNTSTWAALSPVAKENKMPQLQHGLKEVKLTVGGEFKKVPYLKKKGGSGSKLEKGRTIGKREGGESLWVRRRSRTILRELSRDGRGPKTNGGVMGRKEEGRSRKTAVLTKLKMLPRKQAPKAPNHPLQERKRPFTRGACQAEQTPQSEVFLKKPNHNPGETGASRRRAGKPVDRGAQGSYLSAPLVNIKGRIKAPIAP